MKKYIALFVLFLALSAHNASADLLVVDANPLDAATNPQDLANSGEATELAWAKLITGDSDLTFLEKIEFDADNPETTFVEAKDILSISGYIGTVLSSAWEYALVKYGRTSVLYWDSNGDGLLTASAGDIGSKNGISHVSFFGSADTPVPEPSTMLLLGTGIAGLAGLARRRRW